MPIQTFRNTIQDEGTYINYSISNPFYMYCQEYYRDYYSNYLAPCLQLADGTTTFRINDRVISNQMFISTIGNGLVKKLFANGIDFTGDAKTKNTMVNWSNETHLLKELEKGWKYAFVGGTSLIKINRSSNLKLYITTHRIDTFYADTLPNGEIMRVRVYEDLICNTSKSSENGEVRNQHYMLLEERKYNSEGKPVSRHIIYRGTGSLNTNAMNKPQDLSSCEVGWTELPSDVRKIVKDRYPDIIIGKETYLPFVNDLGVRLWSWTTDNPRVPDLPFGQPAGDILQSESRQYDHLKAFEEWEVKMAKAKATLPSEYINQDDPLYQENGMDDNFFTKVDMGGDNNTIEKIQFSLRSGDIRVQKENIIRDTAFKLNVSCSTIASFLSEGSSSKTATEIVSEKTHTDTFIKDQINLIKNDLNQLIGIVARYLNCIGECNLVFRYENQNSHIDTMKIYSDAFNTGICSPERYVNDVYGYLSENEKRREIDFISKELERRNSLKDSELQAKQILAETTPTNEFKPLREQDKPSVGGMKQKISDSEELE